jgi:hypothetical protein
MVQSVLPFSTTALTSKIQRHPVMLKKLASCFIFVWGSFNSFCMKKKKEKERNYKCQICRCHWEILGFHSNELSTMNMSHERKVLSRVWVTIDGFRLVIGFIDHLQIVTTSNYSAIANSRTLQSTTTRTKSSQSAMSTPVVAWLRLQWRTFPYSE